MKGFSPVALGVAVLLCSGNGDRVCGAATESTPAARVSLQIATGSVIGSRMSPSDPPFDIDYTAVKRPKGA